MQVFCAGRGRLGQGARRSCATVGPQWRPVHPTPGAVLALVLVSVPVCAAQLWRRGHLRQVWLAASVVLPDCCQGLGGGSSSLLQMQSLADMHRGSWAGQEC